MTESNIQLHYRNDLHLLRKVWHILTGLFGLVIYEYFEMSKFMMGQILVGLGFIAFIFEMYRVRNEWVNGLTLKIMGPFMRVSEEKSFTGLPFYALGAGLSLLLFNEKIAILSILFLMFADPLASVAGVLWGSRKISKNKSIEGSIAALCTCYFLSLCYGLSFNLGGMALVFFSVLAGFIGMLSEIIDLKIDDNLTIPMISGLGLSLLNIFFQFF